MWSEEEHAAVAADVDAVVLAAAEEAEDGGAGARHSGRGGPRLRRKPVEDVADRRDECARGRFEIVAARAPIAKRTPVDTVPAGKDFAGGKRSPRIHEQHRQPGDAWVAKLEPVPCPIAAAAH